MQDLPDNNIPFWIWSDKNHGRSGEKKSCCFNHLVGLPVKGGKAMPMFDYEKKIFKALGRKSAEGRKDKHVWVKKATGLGVTEFALRYMAWLCYTRDYAGAQMCIVTGPNKELAKGLILRLKEICRPIEVLESKETVAVVNGCRVEAFPSHHLDAMRALARPVFILLDEADFFPKKEQDNARIVAERYIAKSDPYILMISTPNLPAGLFENIEREPKDSCIYNRLTLSYRVGLGRIYTRKEINKARKSPGFDREYDLKYGYDTGNIFPYKAVNACVEEYDLAPSDRADVRVLAVDPAYGSSDFAIMGAEQIGEVLYIKACCQYKRPSPAEMFDIVEEYARDYTPVLVDSAQPGLITDLRGAGIATIPVNFSKNLPIMTSAASSLVKRQGVRIHPCFKDLQVQLKSVVTNQRGNPDKTKGNTFDLGDCLLMLALYFRREKLYVAKI
jgi:hypothetical protein